MRNEFSIVISAVQSRPWLSLAVLAVVGYIVRWYWSRPRLPFPLAKKPWKGDWTQVVMEAKAKYKSPFVLPLFYPVVVLPTSLVNEIKATPESHASFAEFINDRMIGKYTGLSDPFPEATLSVKIELTRNIAKVLHELQDEAVYALDRHIGECPDWKPISVYSTMAQVVALLSGRTFVGLPVCRDQEWLDASINFTKDAMAGVFIMTIVPSILRPFVAPLVPQLYKMRSYHKFAERKLGPTINVILEEMRKKEASEKTQTVAADQEEVEEESHYNMIHWMVNHAQDPLRVEAGYIAKLQLFISFAAIHTTCMALTHVIYDLACYPEVQEELRREYQAVKMEENYPDLRLKKTSMPKLRKLDSFIKESQRMNPPSLLAMQRKITCPSGLTLSTGETIPYGAAIGFSHAFEPNSTVPEGTIMRHPSQPPLTEFHPFRYVSLRQIPGEENKHQFVTTGPDSIAFGHGPHACPGRFFASNEIKVLAVELLERYHISLGPNGEGVAEGYSRPKNMTIQSFYSPNMNAKIYFKNRPKVAL